MCPAALRICTDVVYHCARRTFISKAFRHSYVEPTLQLFGEELLVLLVELNETLVA
jgi:hypothetical protein